MGFVFVLAVLGMIVISLLDEKRGVQTKGYVVDKADFAVDNGFLAGAILIVGLLLALYTAFW
jgi:SSS family solute:Na+ symporter